MEEKYRTYIGGALLIIGSAISLYGAHANNIWLDHELALRIWSIGNVVQLAWGIGLWRKWWDGGLPAIALCVLYGYYTITNFIAIGLI
jgi:hypothetical protein